MKFVFKNKEKNIKKIQSMKSEIKELENKEKL